MTPERGITPDNDRTARAELYRNTRRDFIDKLNVTRQIEWLFNGALWAGLVASPYFVGGHVDLATVSRCVLAGIASLVAAMHCALWMWPMKSSQVRDQGYARIYLWLMHLALEGRDMEALGDERQRGKGFGEINGRLPSPPHNVLWVMFGDWAWTLLATVLTWILAFGALLVLKCAWKP